MKMRVMSQSLRKGTRQHLRAAFRCACAGVILVLFTLAVQGGAGCRRETNPPQESETQKIPKAGHARLVFPEKVQVEDASVNRFVADVMSLCAQGDYDAFRLRWSAREEPPPRHEFTRGWDALEEIEVLALQKAAFERDKKASSNEPETIYVLLAEVRLDPQQPAARENSRRSIVLMMVREFEEWRLAKAPGPMRDWIKNQAGYTEEGEAAGEGN